MKSNSDVNQSPPVKKKSPQVSSPPPVSIFVRVVLVLTALVGGWYGWSQAYYRILSKPDSVPMQAIQEPTAESLVPSAWLEERIQIVISASTSAMAETIARSLTEQGFTQVKITVVPVEQVPQLRIEYVPAHQELAQYLAQSIQQQTNLILSMQEVDQSVPAIRIFLE